MAGHKGMVGSAIMRELKRQGYTNLITKSHKELDLCRQNEVEKFFAEEKPEYVFLAVFLHLSEACTPTHAGELSSDVGA